MVSFRFHIVSIVAVFLALAIGIGMGVTVIDKATVDLLQQRLESVRGEVDAANRRSDQLQRELARTESFDEVANDYLISGRLADVPVTIVSVRGVDGSTHSAMRQALQDAGARVQGTLWFTDKVRLRDSSDISDLQRILGSEATDPNQLRQAMTARVAGVLAGGSSGEQLTSLVSGGFLDWDSAAGAPEVADVSFGSGRTVVLSSLNASVPNAELAVPLTRQLAAQPVRRLVAAEAGQPAAGDQPEQRGGFVNALRDDGSLNDRLSSVDNVETARGRVALVLALRNLDAGITGDYGVASTAEAPLPSIQQ